MQMQVVNFRADRGLIAALVARARHEGVTVSDVIRQAVREQVAH